MMNGGGGHLATAGVISLLMAVLLCGCEEKEFAKTIVLSDETALEKTGINIKSIQEYTYGEGIIDIVWSDDAIGNLCVIRFPGEQGAYQKVNVYQKTASEEVVFEESIRGYVKAAPGGKYIAHVYAEDNIRKLAVYEVETGKKEVIKEWDLMSGIDDIMWSGDGTKLFVQMNMEDGEQDQNVADEESTEYVYRFDMESEEKTENGVKIPAEEGKWTEMFPNEDGSKVFIEEEYFEEEELGIKGDYIISDEWGIDAEENSAWAEDSETVTSGLNKRSWLLDMETGEVKELDSTRMNMRTLLKYTDEGLFGTDGDKLWLAREPLGQTAEKRLLEEECMDICICEKGDHIFLIEMEERMNYLQVIGILLEDGEIQEYQVLYKGMVLV